MWLEQNDNINTPLYIRILITIYFALEFFEPYINAAYGSFTKYYLILLILVLIYFNGFSIVKDRICISFILWFVYKCFTILWCDNSYIYHLHFFTNITAVILLYLLVMRPFSKATLDNIVVGLWGGSSIIGVLSIFFNAPFMGVSNRIVLNLFGKTLDPNNDAAFLVVAISISLIYLIDIKKGRLIKIASVGIILINTYALFLTGSRGGFVTEIAIFLIVGMFYIQKGKHKLFFLVLMGGLIACAYYIGQKFLPADIYIRLFETAGYEGGGERTTIWNNAFNMMNSNPLYYFFGAGWGSYFGYNGYTVVMHNTYLSMLCDTGIIGLCLFYCPIIKGTQYLYKKRIIMPIVLLVSGLLPAFFLESINKRFFWNAILVLLMYYKVYKYETE